MIYITLPFAEGVMARPLHSRQAGVPPLPTPQCPMRTESGPLAGELNKWRRSPSGGEAVVSRGGAASLAGGVGGAGLVDLAGSGGRGGRWGWAGSYARSVSVERLGQYSQFSTGEGNRVAFSLFSQRLSHKMLFW